MEQTPLLGLLGLPNVAEYLMQIAGDRLRVISDPDLRVASRALQAAARKHGFYPVLVRNDPELADLIPGLRYHVQVMVLGTVDHPVAESEGNRTYQLPASLADLVKQLDFDPDELHIPASARIDESGRLVDETEIWDRWNNTNSLTAPAPVVPAPVDPVPGPPAPAVAAPQPTADLATEVFGAGRAIQQALRGGAHRTGLGEAVFLISGSGGVGKSTLALSLAGRAADRGKNVVLIDANLGQPDLATYLKVGEAGLPTMTHAVVKQPTDLARAIIDPDRLNAARNARSARARPLRFALVQGPARGDARRISMATVNDLVVRAREMADLVVVDTQIIESDDPRNMIKALLLPQLGRQGWAVTATSMSSAGVANMLMLLEDISGYGINPARLLTVLSRFDADAAVGHEQLEGVLRQLSVPVGTAWTDPGIPAAMNAGEPVYDRPGIASVCDAILARMFADLPAAVEPPHSRRRPWTRRRGGKQDATHRDPHLMADPSTTDPAPLGHDLSTEKGQ